MILHRDPVGPLVCSGDHAVEYFARRDLVGEAVPEVETIWALPPVHAILRRQQPDGSWKPAAGRGPTPLLETYRNLRLLVDQYELKRSHRAIQQATEYVFSCQTREGDIRGVLANQYAPYYTGAILYLLIKAGYGDDNRVAAGLRWLLSVRQADGGWVIGSPGIVGLGRLTVAESNELTSRRDRATARAFDWTKPFSAAGTGMVLRAFSVHPEARSSPEAQAAARLLKSRLLRKDNWSSYGHPDNWVRFDFPFWWTNLVSALDTLSLLGFLPDDEDVDRGICWLVEHQQADGLWLPSYSRIHRNSPNSRTRSLRLWVSLAICRVLRRFGAWPAFER